MKISAVCFDMDGTLIRNTDSVKYLCTLSNRLEEFERIECREDERSITWIEGDYLKAELVAGLGLSDVEDKFADKIELIHGIAQVLEFLRARRIKSVLITAGPIQVASIIGKMFSFDGVYGSTYEVVDSRFTGRITTHLGNHGKLTCLGDFCLKSGLVLENCVAIGDSSSDIAVFRKCGKSIAINYSDSLKGKGSEHIITEDLSDVIDIIDSWLGE
ncbi:MAG: HAD-IB family phosphatase [bacterium]